jgi:hypothetical protein
MADRRRRSKPIGVCGPSVARLVAAIASVQGLGKHSSLAAVRRPHVEDKGYRASEIHHFGVAVFSRLDQVRPIPPCATMSTSQKPGAGFFQSLNVRIGTSRRIAE